MPAAEGQDLEGLDHAALFVGFGRKSRPGAFQSRLAERRMRDEDVAETLRELPTSVELVISHTDPGLQGDRSTGGTKPATLETGAEIQVPLFLSSGARVKVDTRDGRYLGRVS